MRDMLNAIADHLDRLVDAQGPDDRWRAGLRMLAAHGAEWVTAATAPRTDPHDATLRSSVPPTLMRDYVGEAIYRDDPFLPLCAAGTGVVDLDVAAGLATGRTPGGRRLAALIDAYGVRHATLFPVYGGPRPGGLVLYARDRENVAALRHPMLRRASRVAVALFAGHCRPEPDSDISAPLYTLRPRLSAREREALAWLATGLQTARIAERMEIAIPTVEKHLMGARRKLGARTREQALALAIARGEVAP